VSEQPVSPPPARSGGGNFFTQKLGPMPMWAWIGIATAGVLMFYLYRKNQAAASTAAASTSTSTGTDTTDSSLIPQFVNQVYTNNTPPAAPPSTTTSTSPPVTGTTVAVPNVANMTADEAEQTLSAIGLKPDIKLTAASDKPGIFHIITKTSPAAGSSVAPGQEVVLYYKDSKNS